MAKGPSKTTWQFNTLFMNSVQMINLSNFYMFIIRFPKKLTGDIITINLHVSGCPTTFHMMVMQTKILQGHGAYEIVVVSVSDAHFL